MCVLNILNHPPPPSVRREGKEATAPGVDLVCSTELCPGF